jgi:hypothetical protein
MLTVFSTILAAVVAFVTTLAMITVIQMFAIHFNHVSLVQA